MIVEDIDSKTRELVSSLSSDPAAAENALRDWFQTFPKSFYRVVGAGLERKAETFVHRLIAADEECCNHLCNPALLDAATAKKLARALLLVELRLDVRLTHAAVAWAAEAKDQKPLRRCLEIIEAMESGPRINSALVQLLNCCNVAVRSKVVSLLVRSSANETNIRAWLRESDPRIRANVLESLAETGRGVKWIQQILLENLNDAHGRAAANAAVGLYRMGVEEPAVARLSEMASSEDPSVRRSAAWGMGQVTNAEHFDLLHRLRKDSDSRVRWHALRSLGSFNRAGVKSKEAAPSQEPQQNSAELPLAAGGTE
jgi:hypothetical protein